MDEIGEKKGKGKNSKEENEILIHTCRWDVMKGIC